MTVAMTSRLITTKVIWRSRDLNLQSMDLQPDAVQTKLWSQAVGQDGSTLFLRYTVGIKYRLFFWLTQNSS